MKNLLALLAISTLLLSSCMKKEGVNAGMDMAMKAADSAKNANIAGYKAVGEMMSTGKWDGVEKYFVDNFVEHQLMPGQKQGLAGLKEMMAGMHAAFPDMKFTTLQITADSNWIWAHFNMSGTNTGSFMGMPATGKKIDINGMDLIKLQNGKCVEHWGYMDEHKMMQQLGLAPADPAPAPPTADKK